MKRYDAHGKGAKNHEGEAEIIAQAGQKGAVTISTNMAGRCTDIVLGEGVTDLGGLHILGTERHESRRIDNQLRGRAGRQGDPGSSRFYLALEDDLLQPLAEFAFYGPTCDDAYYMAGPFLLPEDIQAALEASVRDFAQLQVTTLSERDMAAVAEAEANPEITVHNWSAEERAKFLQALEGEIQKQLKLVDGILDVQVQVVTPEFDDPPTTESYTLSPHDAFPI